MNKNKVIIPIIEGVIAALCFLCLADMPYGFYELFRFIAAAAFLFLAFEYYKVKDEKLCYGFVALAILFQPLLKITLGRTIWNIVDVIVGIGFIVLIVRDLKVHGGKTEGI